MRKHLALIFLLFSFAQLFGQNYKFKTLSLEDGLSQPFIYTLNEDQNGYIWIGTGEGLAKYDGEVFTTYLKDHGLTENFISSSLNDGSLTWYGHNQGGITLYDGEKFWQLDTKNKSQSTINAITKLGELTIVVSQQNGLFVFKGKELQTVYYKKLTDLLCYSIQTIDEQSFLLGTNEGVFHCKIGEEEISFLRKIENVPSTKVNFMTKIDEEIFVCTQDEGIYTLQQIEQDFRSSKFYEDFPFSSTNIQHILKDKHNDYWISTFGAGLYRIEQSEDVNHKSEVINYNSKNGLGSDFIKNSYQDFEGNIWIATYGNGVAILQDEYFTFFEVAQDSLKKSIRSIYFNDSTQLVTVDNGLLDFSVQRDNNFVPFDSLDVSKLSGITAVTKDHKGTLWIGTERNGLYYLDTAAQKFNKVFLDEDNLSNSINFLLSSEAFLYVATKNGLFALDIDSKFTIHYTTKEDLPHNNVNHIHIDSKGDLWIATSSSFVSKFNGQAFYNYRVSKSTEPVSISSIISDKNGNIWVATYGHGIYYREKDQFNLISDREGLKSNYCYSLIEDKNNNIWVGHRGGISRVSAIHKTVRSYGRDFGITHDCNFNSIAKDKAGNVWFGTNKGLIKYDPLKERNSSAPPKIILNSIKINDVFYTENDHIDLPFATYNLRVEFTGISYRNNNNVTYQYKLEGYDNEWSEGTPNNFVVYNNLQNGNYTFYVKACNADGACSETPISFTVFIDKPIYKKWWFITLVVGGFLYTLYFFVNLRIKRHRKIEKILKETLHERTKEVRHQKDELEKKNKDITDSITYALRIQEAVLPEVNRLHRIFPDSFVFYKPRDIVSGDFYWFERFGKKLVVICADCTGHGVPGAFMSLIGSILIKDLCNIEAMDRPDILLSALNNEINAVLKQKKAGASTNDGMDISIVDFDLETNVVRTSSAMRPILIYRKGETIEIRGDRKSIGGDNTEKVKFSLNEFDLEKGDRIYLFTDGFADQFGGPKGKKLKVSAFYSFLDRIQDKSMSEQHNLIENFFSNWKGDQEQIDDVLVIGIEI